MNLCRVLPLGLDAKAAVDEAINRWALCAACCARLGVVPAAWALERPLSRKLPVGFTAQTARVPALGRLPSVHPLLPPQVRRHRQPACRHPCLQGGSRGQRAGGGGG